MTEREWIISIVTVLVVLVIVALLVLGRNVWNAYKRTNHMTESEYKQYLSDQEKQERDEVAEEDRRLSR